MSPPAISVEGLGKRYALREGRRADTLRDAIIGRARSLAKMGRGRSAASEADTFWALQEVSFAVGRGEVLGIVGRNGAGKSTLLRILSRITEPTTGSVRLRGRMASLLEVGTGFHPELSGRDNIFLNGSILGMSRREIRARFDEIVAFAEVERFLDMAVKHYSSGMYVRLAFSVAAHLQPDILVVDEVLAVGDTSFQKKCLGKMNEVAGREGRTVLFVSHNLQQVRQLCRRAILLQGGRLIADGPVHATLNVYHEGLRQSTAGAPHSLRPRIQSVRFLGPSGEPAERVDRSGEIQFVAEIETPVSLGKPLFSMAVIHESQHPVFSEHIELPGALAPGTHRIRGRFAASALKPEAYFLSTWLFDGETLWDRQDGQNLPEIVDALGDPHVEARRWGTVRIPVTWDVG